MMAFEMLRAMIKEMRKVGIGLGKVSHNAPLIFNQNKYQFWAHFSF